MRLPLSALVLVALVLTACSGGGGDDKTAETKHHEATTTTATVADLKLTRGEVAVASAGGDVTLDEKTQQAVVDAAKSYIDAAVISPVSDGKVGKDYDGLFDSAVSANATGPDRAALTDDGIPKATKKPTVTATPVRIDALADKDGKVVLLGATFDVDVRATSAGGAVTVHRTNELTYAPVDNGWKITAYRVSVERATPEGSTSSTAETTTP
jgi:hypothetical protein